MKFARSIFLLAAPALLLGHAGAARAQEGAQPKTPPTPTQAVLENWNDVGSRLITMAQDWPEDKYTLQTESSRTHVPAGLAAYRGIELRSDQSPGWDKSWRGAE